MARAKESAYEARVGSKSCQASQRLALLVELSLRPLLYIDFASATTYESMHSQATQRERVAEIELMSTLSDSATRNEAGLKFQP